MRGRLRLCASVLTIGVTALAATPASAVLVTFDDYTSSPSKPITGLYDGLTWLNLAAVAPSFYGGQWPVSGAANGIKSLFYVATNGSVNNASANSPAEFSSKSPFTFETAYFMGVWYDQLNITVQGERNGVVVDSSSFMVGTSQSVLETFHWSGLDAVVISSSGGVFNKAINGPNNRAFAIDNVVLVPEPETYALFLAGLGFVGVYARRQR